MDYLGAAVSSLTSIIFFTLVAAGVLKAYQIATTLTEIKDLLIDLRRTAGGPIPQVPFASAESAENLLRAVSAELDHPVPPAVIEHKS